MFYRITTSLVISILLFSSNALSEPGNISITDFTMHKVMPQQDAPKPQPVIEKKAPPKTTKTVEKPATKPEPAEKTIVKTPEAEKKEQAPKKQASPQKKAAATSDADSAEPGITIIKSTTIPEEKIKKLKDFNKQNYTDNLNSYLDKNPDQPKAAPNNKNTDLKTYNHYDYIVKPTLSLGIVLVLILIFAWLYNKLKAINPNALFSGKFNDMDVNKFTVLASSSLGQGKVIHLVEINGKQLVVGSTNNNISLLSEISPEDMENLKAKAEKNKNPRSSAEPTEDDELENIEPNSYSARYSNLYKDYIE